MAGWYVRRGEKVVGPLELPKLQELVATERLLPTDQLAKDVEGPWKEAGSTTLFAKPIQAPVAEPVPPPFSISPVPKVESLPTVVEPMGSSRAVTQAVRVAHVVFGGIGRGMLATWGAVSRSMATRAQRKHELKIAKIQAKVLADSQQPPAPQQISDTTSGRTPVYVPQVHQTTVVQVINKNTQSVYGCSGCGLVLLLIFIGLVVLFIASAPPSP